MSLPAATPAACSTPVRVDLSKCWAKNEDLLTPESWSCTNAPADEFGLCRLHRQQILGGDRA